MSNEDFVSFDKALRDLQMRSEELRKLVSEGEIRAFRDGASMKFRREDVDSLQLAKTIDDSLEDDTGMVTEELSDEDTLLVADDDEFEELTARATPVVAASTTRGARARAVEVETSKEPGWVTAFAILTTVVMLWGFMVAYSLATEAPTNGFNTMLSMAGPQSAAK